MLKLIGKKIIANPADKISLSGSMHEMSFSYYSFVEVSHDILTCIFTLLVEISFSAKGRL